MTKLNQILAIEKGVKSQTTSEISDLYKLAQKAELFNGFSKVYQPINEDAKRLPPESKKVQFSVADVLTRFTKSMTALMDVTAKKEFSNTVAVASLIIGSQKFSNVPVTYLLFMEKQLTDLRTFIASLPILSADETWWDDPATGLYKTDAKETHRLEKVQKAIVLYPHSAEHPAQTQLITEDVLAGYWSSTQHSGAIPKPKRDDMLGRVDEILKAVKMAREEANNIEVIAPASIADSVFDYVIGG